MEANRPDLPISIPRSEHSISRSQISPNALKVMYRLRAAGHRACLVGGGVRDLLLGREPKDFDVGTSAHPEEVYRLFRNCRLIGRRFRLAHVQFGSEIIEVATFRAQTAAEDDDGPGVVTDDEGRILSDNVYGTIEDDAWRRDFTINALYYDIESFAVLDYVGGMEDLRAGVIRLIGDPEQRYREDPVRMLRAVRFAAKLGMRIHPDSEAALHSLAHLLRDIPPARLFDEVLKLFLAGYAVQTFELLRLHGLFRHLFPATDRCLRRELYGHPRVLVTRALTNTDARIAEDKPVTPAFLYAALLWEPVRARFEVLLESGLPVAEAMERAADEIVGMQLAHTALPRRFALPMREIWMLQPRFAELSGKKPHRLATHPRFRAAYDFMLLRAASGEPLSELAEWWQGFVTPKGEVADDACSLDSEEAAPRRRRRTRPRRPRPVSES
ncbi:poly(A) polymerase [Plasticicumulans acidivorans]|uniref:Poly(A) polymerase I n=1 Tax=Plasticicumulans acidivorans TaxID=886464 RepID=A0A317MWY7_9GAMM|nr:poly(A) polymerase [Plasticicumulans acidivorans]